MPSHNAVQVAGATITLQRLDDGAWAGTLIAGGTAVQGQMGGVMGSGSNNTQNLLLRTPPQTKEGYAVEVLVENEPTNEFEHTGLVWYVDDDNYAILVGERQVSGTVFTEK